MEAILLGIYAFFVWLIFIRLKWLPWNTQTQVIVVIIPVVGMAALILTLNVVAPTSPDVRVLRYTVAVVPQVRGRVVEVAVEEGNRPVRRGDVLFRIDPTPYQLEVNALEAQLANAAASQREIEQQLKGAEGKVFEVRASAAKANARIAEITAQWRRPAARSPGTSSRAGGWRSSGNWPRPAPAIASTSNSRRPASGNSRGNSMPRVAGSRRRRRPRCSRSRPATRSGRNWVRR